MMSEIKNIFDISGRAMAAQMVRLNTVASNLANAGTISGTKEEAFRALKPVFQTTYADQLKASGVSTVDVLTVAEVKRDFRASETAQSLFKFLAGHDALLKALFEREKVRVY